MENWILSVAFKKAAVQACNFVAATIAARAMRDLGVPIDQTLLAAGLMMKLEVLRGYLKNVRGWTWLP